MPSRTKKLEIHLCQHLIQFVHASLLKCLIPRFLFEKTRKLREAYALRVFRVSHSPTLRAGLESFQPYIPNLPGRARTKEAFRFSCPKKRKSEIRNYAFSRIAPGKSGPFGAVIDNFISTKLCRCGVDKRLKARDLRPSYKTPWLCFEPYLTINKWKYMDSKKEVKLKIKRASPLWN